MHSVKQLFDKKYFKQIFCFLIAVAVISLLWLTGQLFNMNKFLEAIELKTLDFRYSMLQKAVNPNPDIVILTIDDNSLELLENEFGKWPWSRDAYTKVINYIESGGVNEIIFDLMFIGNQKGFKDKDNELAKTVNKYNNIYLSMNFDTRNNLTSPDLPDRLKVNLENNDPALNFSTFTNCRMILDKIVKNNPNIGIINLTRDEDGISRRCPLFVKYKNNFYPYLAFKAAYNYLKKREHLNTDKFVINKDGKLILGRRKIQLDNEAKMIINWYGPEHTFTYIPFSKVIKSINALKAGRKAPIPPSFFKNKLVFVGVNAASLFDIKSTPLSNIFPGVEIQATTFNNIIDNNSIKRATPAIDFLICILLSVITGIMVIRLRSTFTSSIIILTIAVLYVLFASFLLKNYFIWVAIVNPIIIMTITFTLMYIIKYILKSRDFEYTYKLATTDGLTNLYNHRFFQEHLINAIERAKRYKNHFSIILIDIDFFKKFNDTYGHQAGDAVLRQVADTLKKTIRASDLVARYGGEEMAIILDNADIDEAVSIAAKVCKTVGTKTYRLSETISKNVTISLGVATYPQHGQTPNELIEFADQGLYWAKENGRNQVGKIENYIPPIKIDDEIL